MGYWINHHVRVTGNKEDIEVLAAKLTQRRPKSLNDEGDIVWSEEEFSFYNIISPPEELLMSGEWWTEVGGRWRQEHWGCYDAPAEEFDVFSPYGNQNHNNTRVINIRIDTKYDWPIGIFHELINQYPSLVFDIWSEGEESEAVEIKGVNGTWTQTEYEAPNCHADWEARDMLDNCWCSNYSDSSEWYEDCPRDELGIYKVVTTHTHYIYADNEAKAIMAIEAFENTFEMPANTKIQKYDVEPKFLIEMVDEVPNDKE